MDLATAMLLVLGLLFFGGIGYLVWRERKKGSPENTADVSMAQPRDSQHEEPAQRKRRTR
jgi:hypothetical protein